MDTITNVDSASIANMLAALPEDQRAEILSQYPDIKDQLAHNWRFLARPEQLAPVGDWSTHLYCAGRGAGKTRSGGGWASEYAKIHGPECRLAFIAPTNNDARDIMLLGESGIIASASPDFRPLYEPSKRKITWPNGAQAWTFSSEEPDRLRGHQFWGGWCDELTSWQNAQECWDMYQFCLRLGPMPQTFVTTTPKPTKLLIDLFKRAKDPESRISIVRGKTYDNAANLAPSFVSQIIKRYEGTRLGRQEIDGELLLESESALWQQDTIDLHRIPLSAAPKLEDYIRIVVAIDPAVTSLDKSDETGIVIVGKMADGHIYVIRDISGRFKPHQWALNAVSAYHAYSADRIVAEANNGGDMVEQVVRLAPNGENVSFKKVFATKGKYTRAEPIAALYAQGTVHHVGTFDALEAQLVQFDPQAGEKSPDRLDALVWGVTELTLGQTAHKFW